MGSIISHAGPVMGSRRWGRWYKWPRRASHERRIWQSQWCTYWGHVIQSSGAGRPVSIYESSSTCRGARGGGIPVVGGGMGGTNGQGGRAVSTVFFGANGMQFGLRGDIPARQASLGGLGNQPPQGCEMRRYFHGRRCSKYGREWFGSECK